MAAARHAGKKLRIGC